MKIKDLPENYNIVGCRLGGKRISSEWNKGFWLEKEKGSLEVLPVFFKDFNEIKNWEIEVPEFKI